MQSHSLHPRCSWRRPVRSIALLRFGIQPNKPGSWSRPAIHSTLIPVYTPILWTSVKKSPTFSKSIAYIHTGTLLIKTSKPQTHSIHGKENLLIVYKYDTTEETTWSLVIKACHKESMIVVRHSKRILSQNSQGQTIVSQ